MGEGGGGGGRGEGVGGGELSHSFRLTSPIVGAHCGIFKPKREIQATVAFTSYYLRQESN